MSNDQKMEEARQIIEMAANLDTGQDCDPDHHALVVAAMDWLEDATPPLAASGENEAVPSTFEAVADQVDATPPDEMCGMLCESAQPEAQDWSSTSLETLRTALEQTEIEIAKGMRQRDEIEAEILRRQAKRKRAEPPRPPNAKHHAQSEAT